MGKGSGKAARGTVKGTAELKRALEGLDKRVRNKVIKTALRKGAKSMAGEVKAGAPVLTGKLRRSVKVRAGKRKKNVISIRVEVSGGHETSFVAAVEYGAADQHAQPFIRPAFDARKGPVGAELVAGLKAGIEAAGR